MNPLLLSIAVAIAQPPATDRGAAAPPAQAPAPVTTRAPAAVSPLDGTWSVITFERGGQAVPGAAGGTATIVDNTLTFDAAAPTGGRTTGTAPDTGTGPTSRASSSGTTVGTSLRPLRLDLAPMGIARVTELDTAPPARAGTADRAPAGRRANGSARSGVYVMTRDFLAVSIPDQSTGGTPTTGGTPVAPVPGATDPAGGGTGIGTPGAGGTTGASSSGITTPPPPNYMTLVLQRTTVGAATAPRTGTGR